MNPRIRLLAHRYKNSTEKERLSPQFKSKVTRSKQHDISWQMPGPGQYQVSLPIVKPIIEAIQKNHHSIIIKVNSRNSPAFQSLQPRFKQQKSLQAIDRSQLLQSENAESIHELRNKKKLKHHSPPEHWRSKDSVPSIQSYTVQMRKSKDIVPLKLRQKKGSEWSKYRGVRNQWTSLDNVPGPGAYNTSQVETRYHIKNHSWQFKSSTLRGDLNETVEQYNSEIPKDIALENELQSFQKTVCIHSLMRN